MSRAGVTPLKTYEVTGTLDPDVTGIYEDAGEFGGERYYELAGNGWFIWWNGINRWYITSVRGGINGAHWRREQPDIEGLYEPIFGALGTATVTEI